MNERANVVQGGFINRVLARHHVRLEDSMRGMPVMRLGVDGAGVRDEGMEQLMDESVLTAERLASLIRDCRQLYRLGAYDLEWLRVLQDGRCAAVAQILSLSDYLKPDVNGKPAFALNDRATRCRLNSFGRRVQVRTYVFRRVDFDLAEVRWLGQHWGALIRRAHGGQTPGQIDQTEQTEQDENRATEHDQGLTGSSEHVNPDS